MVHPWVGKLSSMPWGCECYVWRWHQQPRHETRHEALRWKAASYHRSGEGGRGQGQDFSTEGCNIDPLPETKRPVCPRKVDLWHHHRPNGKLHFSRGRNWLSQPGVPHHWTIDPIDILSFGDRPFFPFLGIESPFVGSIYTKWKCQGESSLPSFVWLNMIPGLSVARSPKKIIVSFLLLHF